MAIEYQIKALYEQFFGEEARKALKDPFIKSNEYQLPDFEGVVEGVNQAAYSGLSNAVGYPIFMPIGFIIDQNKKGKDRVFWLPNEPLAGFSRERRIVTTSLPGTDGTIKEDMGLNDWEIEIKGIATVDNFDVFPYSSVKSLRKLSEIKTSISVIGPAFENHGITMVHIKRLSLPELKGVPNAQPYIIQAYSDDVGDIIKTSLTREDNQI